MIFEQIIGWSGNILVVLGCYLLMRKNTQGFLVSVFGNISYLIQGITMTNYSLIVLNILLIIINFSSWMKWKNEFRKAK